MSAPRPVPPQPEALLRPLRRLLRPLVRLLMQSGVTFPVFADLVRSLFLDVAAHDLLTDPRGRTDSRISLMTGIHRKEIRRMRPRSPSADEVPAVVTVGSQIVARWLVAPWCGPDGTPLALPRTSAANEPSFERLVETVTTDVRSRAVLDDLVDQGTVSVTGEVVRLEVAGFLPRQGRAEQLFYFARNLHDHIAAAAANVVSPSPAPFLERAVNYDRLTEAAAARIEAAARLAANQMLVEVNRLAAAEADAQSPGPGLPPPRRRVNLGAYMYVEDEPDAETG